MPDLRRCAKAYAVECKVSRYRAVFGNIPAHGADMPDGKPTGGARIRGGGA